MMALTEEQLQEAAQELARRDAVKRQEYELEWQAKQDAAEERFWVGMQAKYPDLDRDTMYDIYSDIDDFFR